MSNKYRPPTVTQKQVTGVPGAHRVYIDGRYAGDIKQTHKKGKGRFGSKLYLKYWEVRVDLGSCTYHGEHLATHPLSDVMLEIERRLEMTGVRVQVDKTRRPNESEAR